MKKFIYFPSFSVGDFGSALKNDTKLSGGLPLRFYSEEFPKKYQHPYFLTTAGHFYKTTEYAKKTGMDNGTLLLGDSGGFQIASGALKWCPTLVPKIFQWLEDNSHIAMNLDIPPRMEYAGQYSTCLNISKQNFKYFADNQTGKTKFLNVLQGEDDHTYKKWYDEIKQFSFNGWGIGGCGGSLFRFMSGIATLLGGKEHLKDNNLYWHILGTSKITDFLILSQLQKSLCEVNSNVTVTTDSSSPTRSVVYGLYYIGHSLKGGQFSCMNIEKRRTGDRFKTTSDHLPIITEFDYLLKDQYNMENVYQWDSNATLAIGLHNFMYFKYTMDVINELVGSDPLFLEQCISSDMFMVLQSIDAMVKSDNPMKIFNTYKPLYQKLSNTLIPLNTSLNKHFEF